MTDPFVGAKLALFHGPDILTLQRDDLPTLPWAGMWDLPGGGREGGESAETCALRELAEELALILPPARLLWRAKLPAIKDPSQFGYVFAGEITPDEIATIRLGSEGQAWRMMPLAEFLADPHAIPAMQDRARLAWTALYPR